MTRVDLDAIEEMAATYNSILLRLNVPALVAELRAAREALGIVRSEHDQGAEGCRSCEAVATYDQAVGP